MLGQARREGILNKGWGKRGVRLVEFVKSLSTVYMQNINKRILNQPA
jgi:hypothetical protein